MWEHFSVPSDVPPGRCFVESQEAHECGTILNEEATDADPRLDPRLSRHSSRLPPGVDDRNPQQVEQWGSPGRTRDPKGLAQAIWDELVGESLGTRPADKLLTVAAYDAGNELAVYVDALALGDRLPDAPLFLAPG